MRSENILFFDGHVALTPGLFYGVAGESYVWQ